MILGALRAIGWLICLVYATIPSFWLVIHLGVDYWRARPRSPYQVLLPVWLAMWIALAALTWRWRSIAFYTSGWAWVPAAVLFTIGLWIYQVAGASFSWRQLSGLPEVRSQGSAQKLMTSGIRERIRHPVYLGHLCEMLAWSIGTGLVVCYGLTVFAMATGAVMIRLEDGELEKRFGPEFAEYRSRVPAIWPTPGRASRPPRAAAD